MRRGLGSAGAPQQPAQAGAAQTLAPGSTGETSQASPEEQAQYEQFVKSVHGVMFPEAEPGTVNPAIVNNLQGQFDPKVLEAFQAAEPALTDSPQDSLAATTVLLTMMGDSAGDFTDDVVMHGGVQVLEDLVEIAEASKIHEFSEQDIEGATYRAMDLFRIASPRADPVALTEQFKGLMAANEKGELNSVLPGLPGGPAMQKQEA